MTRRKETTSYFVGQHKDLWGFSLKLDGTDECDISKFAADLVKKIIDHYYESDWEIHVMPNEQMPFVMVKNPESIWYYLRSEYEAIIFRENIMVNGSYEFCHVI